MADLEEVEIHVVRGTQKLKTCRAMSNQQLSYNLIERAFIETLSRPWTQSNCGVNYDFGQHASPPLGRCELTWGWSMSGAMRKDAFIVVEEIKEIPCSIMLGPAVGRLPHAPTWKNVFTYVIIRQTKEQQQEQKDRVQLAGLRNPEEIAQDEARIRDRRAKKRKEDKDNLQRARRS